MSSGSEAGSNLRLIDSCITQLKDQGPSRTCDESKEEEEEEGGEGADLGAGRTLLQEAYRGTSLIRNCLLLGPE